MINVLKKSALFVSSVFAFTQTMAQDAKGWHLKDKATSEYHGISIDKAYDFVKTKKLKSKTVIVAVIDSGIDTTHEDLKPILWVNTKEIPGNGIDDDKNGYVDDINGWNFLGGRDGRNVETDSYEAGRVYHNGKEKFQNIDPKTVKFTAEGQEEYDTWLKAKEEIAGSADPSALTFYKKIRTDLTSGDSVIRKDLGKDEYTCADLKNYTSTNSGAQKTSQMILGICKQNKSDDITNQQLIDEIEGEIRKIEAVDKAPENFRGNIVKDNYSDFNDKFYGNNNLLVNNKSAFHGTHVAGIVAGVRGNSKGIDGVADDVRIMSIRAVPDGDEHDKDIALAIRYAVDNGARVINMSFGKSYSPEKKWVDEAVQYAEAKGVLLVHAAGNDGANLDEKDNYPNAIIKSTKKRANNWITVGASGDPKLGGLAASFSNYSKTEVDVFAPGVQIYSSVPGGNTYGNAQGTSMASPVVAGVAAFIMEYYPALSAKQVKEVIEKSAAVPEFKTKIPGGTKMVNLTDISKTGGVVNAYEAAKLASTMKGEKSAAPAPPAKPKSKVKIKKKG
jgi:cell wall-associated protease